MKTKLCGAVAFLLGIFNAAAQADILIGVAGPMTGEYATGGEQIRRGAEMAVADINAKGGVLGQKLQLEVGDDVCDPKRAVTVAQQMVAKKVAFVYGHWCSGATIPASVVYSDASILEVTHASNPLITERGLKNIFRIFGRDDQQGQVAATFITRRFKDKKIAVVDDKSTYGKGIAAQIAKNMQLSGMKPALLESIDPGEKDYSALISKLKDAGIDTMAYGGYHTEVGMILRQAHEAGLKLTIVGGDSLSNSELVTLAGPAIDHVIFTFAPDHRKDPAAANVVRRFREAKIEPEGYVMYAYAGVQLFVQAAERARSFKYSDLQKTVSEGSFDTVIGKLSFDSKGDSRAPGFIVYQWKGNRYDNVR